MPPAQKFVLDPKKFRGVGGLNLSHRRVGSTTEIRCVYGAPSFVAHSIFRELLKKVKNLTIFWGGIAQLLGRNSKKIKKTCLGVFSF